MAAAFSFGSVGDIIALCEIAVELGRALNDSRGSVKEFQDLEQDLRSLVNILVQVIATNQQYEASPYMKGLHKAVEQIINDCTSKLVVARDTWLEKYGRSFRSQGSGNRVKDTYKKVKWTWEKAEVEKFREELRTNIQRLTLLASLASLRSDRVDNETLHKRIKEVDDAICQRDKYLLEMIESQNRTLEAMGTSLKAQESTMASWSCYAMQCFAFVVRGIEGNTQAIVRVQNELANMRLSNALDPTKDSNLIILNALGKTEEIPWKFVRSWKGLEAIIADQFYYHVGYDMVQRLEYVLEDSCSGKRIDKTVEPNFVLRRGMKLDMNMVFMVTSFSGCCPRCGTEAKAAQDVSVQCQKKYCGMSFRLASDTTMFRASGLSNLASSRTSSRSDGKRHIEELSDETEKPAEPADFQRVSLIERRHKFDWMTFENNLRQKGMNASGSSSSRDPRGRRTSGEGLAMSHAETLVLEALKNDMELMEQLAEHHTAREEDARRFVDPAISRPTPQDRKMSNLMSLLNDDPPGGRSRRVTRFVKAPPPTLSPTPVPMSRPPPRPKPPYNWVTWPESPPDSD